MDGLTRWIASNVLLQSLAIVATLLGAIIFLLKNKIVIIQTLNWILSITFGKMFTSGNLKQKHVDIGSSEASYIIALIGKNVALLTFIFFVRWAAVGSIESVSKIQPLTTYLKILIFSASTIVSVFNLIIGARLGELYRICSEVMRVVDERNSK